MRADWSGRLIGQRKNDHTREYQNLITIKRRAIGVMSNLIINYPTPMPYKGNVNQSPNPEQPRATLVTNTSV